MPVCLSVCLLLECITGQAGVAIEVLPRRAGGPSLVIPQFERRPVCLSPCSWQSTRDRLDGMMTWSSQAFDASSAFPFQLCESCNAQSMLEPAWQRPACLLEVAQLRRIDDVSEFLRQELRVPIPLCASANSDPCLKRL